MAKGRGLAAASLETRQRVASAGGRASHGGGRPSTRGKKGGKAGK
jgi:hypothetical protein